MAAPQHVPRSADTDSPTNVNILDGNAPDLQAECDKYEAKIAEFGGIELFLGGIGPDGHIAFSGCRERGPIRSACHSLYLVAWLPVQTSPGRASRRERASRRWRKWQLLCSTTT